MSHFESALSKYFPNSMPQGDFVKHSYKALQAQGFRAQNTIAFVSVWRDELTLPLVEDIKKPWGEAFIFSSLAGMLFLGKTGFLAAQHHAPNEEGRERHVYFAFPHIGLDADGRLGSYNRPGRLQSSHACGALQGFQKELESRTVNLCLDPDDLEQSLLKQHLFRKLPYGDVPDLLGLTKIAQIVILEELERMIKLTVKQKHTDYAVLTGIQIHGPEEQDFIWPCEVYWVNTGTRKDLSLNN
jgi:hypothetical protein